MKKEILTDDINLLFDGLSKVKTMLNVSVATPADIPRRVRMKLNDPVIYGLVKQAGIAGKIETKVNFNEEDTLYCVFYNKKTSGLKFIRFHVKKM